MAGQIEEGFAERILIAASAHSATYQDDGNVLQAIFLCYMFGRWRYSHQ